MLPEYDGRGIKIAILDSGIDVSLEGMQQTSEGLPKIIDCFDFTGVGDVDTSTIKLTGNGNSLILLSGKEVKIPVNWQNPSNEWHLGIKFLKEIINGEMQTKNKSRNEEEKEKVFKEKNAETAAKDLFIEKISENDDKIDCIVWNDGKKWCACISLNSESLETAKVLTNFRDEHEYCFIWENISCCVTIQNDGNLLQLFIPFNEHGSFVAQVAAANFPNQPEKNGRAPGAQIISMNITNNLNYKTNVNRIEEALKKCIELGVNIVNSSYFRDEFDDSIIINLIKKMVNQHGIIITQSAGNFGPFYATVRRDTEENGDEMLTIGSLFTFDNNMKFNNKIDDKLLPSFIWPYSSKGPLPNGARGVTFVAPSDVLGENPRWHPTRTRIFTGTSCASSNAAGGIACLLSALKLNGIKYNPATIKMVLCNTAFLPDGEDRLQFGNGIIQIESAFEYFKKQKGILPKIKLPTLSIKSKLNEKGIILHKSKKLSYINKYSTKIEHDKEIEWILKLMPEDYKHVEYPKSTKNNLFNVKIDAKELKPGNIYYSEIQGFDSSNISLGPLFHLPITVIVPENAINYNYERNISISSNSLFTHFIQPNKSSCIICNVKLCDPKTGKIEYNKIITRGDNGTENRFTPAKASCPWEIKIFWSKVLEICIYQKVFTEKTFNFETVLKIDFEETTKEEKALKSLENFKFC